MRLFEFEAKAILRRYGIPVPRGEVATTPEAAEATAAFLAGPVALKAQLMVAGRGKAGGIVFANDSARARQAAARLLATTIEGLPVTKLLVEEKLNIAKEFYASVTIDRQTRTFVVLASTAGGIDIEEVAHQKPNSIMRHQVDPVTGFSRATATEMLRPFQLQDDEAAFANILAILYRAAYENDAELVELNPLVKTDSDEFKAADARLIVDDNALFRHPELADRARASTENTPLEAEARRRRLAYIDLSGDIGIVGNGAGLVMATVDVVSLYGGKPANFLDVGGGGDMEITKTGLLLVMSKPGVKAVLVNILGGITRCDIVAQAIIAALQEAKTKLPIVVRMMGTNEVDGNRMLHEAGINTYPSMEKAIEAVVAIS